ncbi:MAG TPA: lysylphosphatidylglycerol synthase domain-containing protein [Nocardioides sp.]|nr:lysylphosphatidylglycerol synthase domain-containing protein [Nocardioides sp.]
MTLLTADAAPAPSHLRGSGQARARRLRYVAGLAVAGVLTGVLPAVAGVPWGALATTVAGVPALWLVGLVTLWLAGLVSHTITLTGAMPGLSHRRALTLSLTGSAVANVLPLGGAAGVALNVRMARAWHFSPQEITAYQVITNVWDVLAKCLVPLVALPVLLLEHGVIAGHVLRLFAVTAPVLGVVALLGGTILASPLAADRAGRLADRVLLRVRPQWTVHDHLVALQADTAVLVRERWRQLSLGMTLYAALLFLLLLGCLTATGAGLGIGAVLAGFAVERLLTLAGLTPGGAGVVEVGLTATLLAFPGSSVGVVSGVILYRLLTFGLEIPVGGLTLGGWLWRRRTAGAA